MTQTSDQVKRGSVEGADGLLVRQELQAKGLDAERVALAVASLKASEVERARAVWRKKFGELPQDAGVRAKQARFLAARGFGGEVIRRVLQSDDIED